MNITKKKRIKKNIQNGTLKAKEKIERDISK